MKNKGLFIVIGVFLIVLFNSVIYGALNTEMFIDGDVYVRVDRNIRITGIKVIEQVGGVYETYNCDYSKDTTSIQVTLPSSDSSIIYGVTITNKGDIDYEVSNIVEESYSNSNIKYEIIDLEKGTVVDGETTHTFKIKLTTTENDSENKGTLVLKYAFQEWVPSLYNMVAHKSRSLDTNIDFGVAPTKETSGVYEMDSTKDDEYPVYYYRGIVENNNVNFAGFCWKAVRTTSTGGVKLIYNGVPASDGSCDNTGEASTLGTSAYNINEHNSIDISYMYDNGSDSEIKKVIDKWYSDNMTEYTGMLEDTEWCNDRSIYSTDERGGIIYNTYYRSNISFKFELNCQNIADKFTVSESNGNGLLKYPVALLTADEATLAGITPSNYTSFSYYNEGIYEWHMSPRSYALAADGKFHSFMFIFSNVGNTTAMYARPSISLVSGTMIKEGNGSVSKPYKLVEDKIQKEWTFDYTGGEQEFKAPYDGVYKLEIWGAQGGYYSTSYLGGYGGYSFGNVDVSKNSLLYINVGGLGTSNRGSSAVCNESYNGGGGARAYSDSGSTCGGGGGATHIAFESGVLSTLSNKTDSVLIVAGGGGGGAWTNAYNYGNGGVGGGYIGGTATSTATDKANGLGGGGTQLSGGCNITNTGNRCGAFGVGYSNSTSTSGQASTGGGGGGYYGGGGTFVNASGGGSGYIGNTLLKDKSMYCYRCQESNEESTRTISTTNVSDTPLSNYAKIGNGYVKITLISKK